MSDLSHLDAIAAALSALGVQVGKSFHGLAQVGLVVKSLEDAGYVIVPKEPTAKMIEAGEAGIDSDCRFECNQERAYRAMIAAVGKTKDGTNE